MIPESLTQLIETLMVLPGVGEKTAQKYAYTLAKNPNQGLSQLSQSCSLAASLLKECSRCHTLTDTPLCEICESHKREQHIVCFVASPFVIILLETMNLFHGLYHVLHGVLSPLQGITKDQLTIQALIQRTHTENIEEIIYALPPSLESEATMQLITQLLPKSIPSSSLARGLPSGTQLEYTDEHTLRHAFIERKQRN